MKTLAIVFLLAMMFGCNNPDTPQQANTQVVSYSDQGMKAPHDPVGDNTVEQYIGYNDLPSGSTPISEVLKSGKLHSTAQLGYGIFCIQCNAKQKLCVDGIPYGCSASNDGNCITISCPKTDSRSACCNQVF